jgi:hypothetical protein
MTLLPEIVRTFQMKTFLRSASHSRESVTALREPSWHSPLGMTRKPTLQSLVAAILTVAVIGNQGTTPEDALRQYEEVLRQLRNAGGPITPMLP